MRHLPGCGMRLEMIVDPSREDGRFHGHGPRLGKCFHPQVQRQSCGAYRTCCVDTATAVLHAVVDRFLVNIQTDVVHSLRNNSWGAHTRFFSIRPFRASSSCLVMPCRAIAVARYKAGTCLILLPRSTLRRSFSTSGSAPTRKNTLYASGMDSVFSIRPCLTRMR